MTPISHEAASRPDPAIQSELLRNALDGAIARLHEASSPGAPLAAAELLNLRDSLHAPPESDPMLAELDSALQQALTNLPDLCMSAQLPEIQQALKTLRRIILIDRHRIDPDPERHRTSLALAIRRVWLISHRAGLLRASDQMLHLTQQLDEATDGAKRARLKEAIDVLTQYITAQEGYGASVRRELDDLTARLLL